MTKCQPFLCHFQCLCYLPSSICLNVEYILHLHGNFSAAVTPFPHVALRFRMSSSSHVNVYVLSQYVASSVSPGPIVVMLSRDGTMFTLKNNLKKSSKQFKKKLRCDIYNFVVITDYPVLVYSATCLSKHALKYDVSSYLICWLSLCST